MKQRITEEQFNELSKEQKEIWIKWTKDHKYTMNELYPIKYSVKWDEDFIEGFPSIGQMIEILDEGFNRVFDINLAYNPKNKVYIKYSMDSFETGGAWGGNDLCDVLWDVVKHKLSLISNTK